MKIARLSMPQSHRGFGIVEIMIALTLGILIMLGVTQIATNNSQTRSELDRSGRQIENATYALRVIESDLTNAAFWGEMDQQTLGQVLPPEARVCPNDRCDPATDSDLSEAECELNWAMRFPVQGGSGAFDCDTVTGETEITPKADTDYLAIRRANSCALGSPGCEAAGDANNFYIQVNAEFDPDLGTDPIPYGIEQAPTGITQPEQFTSLSYKQRDGATLAPQYRLLNRVYYLNEDDQLMRAELVGDEYQQVAMVDGVEMLQLEYGLDSAGNDGQVDSYTDAPSDLDWADVVMVRISMIVRNPERSAGFVDSNAYTVAGAPYVVPADFQNHRRQLYTRTVSLRNVAGRRD
jgi:type IV pilus assembly protein PilW